MARKLTKRGGYRPGSGRKPEPGFIIRPPVRVLTQAEEDKIMALSPRERAVRLTTRAVDPATPEGERRENQTPVTGKPASQPETPGN